MIRLWLPGIVAALFVFTAAVGTIVGHPRDDAEIRRFFSAPEGCAAPCFMDMRPGVTPHDDALAILQAQPWIMNLTDDGDSLRWMWNGNQPHFLSQLDSRFFAGRVDFNEGVVNSISLITALGYGDFLALFGEPNGVLSVTNYEASYVSITRIVGYFDAGFEVQVTFRCPVKRRQEIWNQLVIITYPNRPAAEYDRVKYQWWSC